MTAIVRKQAQHQESSRRHSAAADLADIYDQAGEAYVKYADGDPKRLFAFDGLHAYADRRVWDVLQAILAARHAAGATTLRVLDAGCGPGTWLRRVVDCAHVLGFKRVWARGFEVSREQILSRHAVGCRALEAQSAARVPLPRLGSGRDGLPSQPQCQATYNFAPAS